MHLRILSAGLIVAIFFCLAGTFTVSADEPDISSSEKLLSSVSNSIAQSLTGIDHNLSRVARDFGEADISTADADGIVGNNRTSQPGYAGTILIAGDRTLSTIDPTVITEPLDPAIVEDDAIQYSIRYIKPKMGHLRNFSNADLGVIISRPAVVGNLIGSAVTLLVPWTLCEAIIRPEINGTGTLSIVTQGDGTILYTSHPNELTKVPPDTFSTEFPTFRDVLDAMKTQKEGHMFYELWRAERTDPGSREAYWNTIDLHGTEWRILAADSVR